MSIINNLIFMIAIFATLKILLLTIIERLVTFVRFADIVWRQLWILHIYIRIVNIIFIDLCFVKQMCSISTVKLLYNDICQANNLFHMSINPLALYFSLLINTRHTRQYSVLLNYFFQKLTRWP